MKKKGDNKQEEKKTAYRNKSNEQKKSYVQ